MDKHKTLLEKPKRENHRLSLELRVTMLELAKWYKSHDTPNYANFYRTQLTHTHFYKLNARVLLK